MKRTLLPIALLMLTISGFSQQDMPITDESEPPVRSPKPSSRNKFPPAYNAPNKIAVRSSFSLNTNFSFLYWMPMEDNLEPGVMIDTNSATLTKGEIIDFDFEYKPGFNIGISYGLERDHWDFSANYTRLRSEMKTTPNITAGNHISPIILMPQIAGTNNYNSVTEKWHLTLDFIDAGLSRSYFNGTQLTFRYFLGARGAWIYQNLNCQFGSVGNSVRGISTSNGVVDSTLKSNSWAVGPRIGLNGNWMVGNGLRFYGNGGADLLFTRYDLNREESSTLLNFTYKMNEKQINTLRTHLDLELGLGWGSHFCQNKWYLDLSAGYGFQVFFDQNMFRTFYNSNSFIGETPHGNLYIQGLTVKAELDF